VVIGASRSPWSEQRSRGKRNRPQYIGMKP
jgi:hypothetical protein